MTKKNFYKKDESFIDNKLSFAQNVSEENMNLVENYLIMIIELKRDHCYHKEIT